MDRLSGTISTAGDEPEDAPSDDDGSESVSVQLDDARPESDDTPPVTAPSANLVSLFTDDERRKMSNRCLDDFKQDVESRANHMRMVRKWYELYAGVQKVKNWPFQNAANVNIPILTYAVLQVHGRLFDMLLPSKGDIYHSVPTRTTDPEEVDRAERTELWVNWYIRENIPEYRPSYDATIWQLVIFGDCFRYWYWDYTENRLCAEWIAIDDMVVPYSCKITDPSMRGVPRYTLIRHLSLFELQDRAESGEFDEDVVSKLKPGDAGTASRKDSEFREIVDAVDGKEKGTAQSFLDDEERDVYEQHRWLRFPDDPARAAKNPAFDGKPHPVRVVIDEPSEKILAIYLREEDDPHDARRFVKEKAAFDKSIQDHMAYEVSGGMQPDPQTGAPMPMPTPPPAPARPKEVRQREVCFFTHWMAFQGEGFHGLGLGAFIGPLNEAQNTLFNQQIDRSTVNNAGGGVISRQVRFQRGPIDRQPGKYVEVDAPASAVKDGLQNWPMVPPDPDGRWFVQYIEQMANRTSGSGDTLSGEPIGTNETARAAMARYEQAQKQISVLASRILAYMTCDARIIWRLFSVHLDADEYYEGRCVDGDNKPRQVHIGPDDFKADAKVVPTADPRISSHAQRTISRTRHGRLQLRDAFHGPARARPKRPNSATRCLSRRVLLRDGHARDGGPDPSAAAPSPTAPANPAVAGERGISPRPGSEEQTRRTTTTRTYWKSRTSSKIRSGEGPHPRRPRCSTTTSEPTSPRK